MDWFRDAAVEPAKLSGYVFNPAHQEGWPKGRFLMSLGFRVDEPETVRQAFLAQAHAGTAVETATPFGVKLEVDGSLLSPRGRSGTIRTVWIVEPGRPARFVTFKPLRKPR